MGVQKPGSRGPTKANRLMAGSAADGRFTKVASARGKAKQAVKAALKQSKPGLSPETERRVQTYTTLKKAGGSLMMTVPAPARHALELAEGTEMSVTVDGERLIVEPVAAKQPRRKLRRPPYTLEDLLAQCDFSAPRSEEEQAWIDSPPVGREIW